jgi:hypothetical protein
MIKKKYADKMFVITFSDPEHTFTFWNKDQTKLALNTRKAELSALELMITLANANASMAESFKNGQILLQLDNLSNQEEKDCEWIITQDTLNVIRKGHKKAKEMGKREPEWIRLISLFEQLENPKILDCEDDNKKQKSDHFME